MKSRKSRTSNNNAKKNYINAKFNTTIKNDKQRRLNYRLGINSNNLQAAEERRKRFHEAKMGIEYNKMNARLTKRKK